MKSSVFTQQSDVIETIGTKPTSDIQTTQNIDIDGGTERVVIITDESQEALSNSQEYITCEEVIITEIIEETRNQDGSIITTHKRSVSTSGEF